MIALFICQSRIRQHCRRRSFCPSFRGGRLSSRCPARCGNRRPTQSSRAPFRLGTILCFVWVIGLLGMLGCKQSVTKRSLPAPVAHELPYQLKGRIHQYWGADTLEFGSDKQLHLILIQGVDTPKYGQAYYSQSRNQVMKWLRKKNVRIEVVGRDQWMRETADVFVHVESPGDGAATPQEINVGLELIRQGLGWYDRSLFEGSEAFREAERQARDQRLGLWNAQAPIAPWDFAEQTQTEIDAQLDNRK